MLSSCVILIVLPLCKVMTALCLHSQFHKNLLKQPGKLTGYLAGLCGAAGPMTGSLPRQRNRHITFRYQASQPGGLGISLQAPTPNGVPCKGIVLGGLTCTHLPSYHVSQKSQAIQNSPVLCTHSMIRLLCRGPVSRVGPRDCQQPGYPSIIRSTTQPRARQATLDALAPSCTLANANDPSAQAGGHGQALACPSNACVSLEAPKRKGTGQSPGDGAQGWLRAVNRHAAFS